MRTKDGGLQLEISDRKGLLKFMNIQI